MRLTAKWILTITVLSLSFGAAFIHDVNYYISQNTHEYIYKIDEKVPAKQVILVLGSKVYKNGNLSPILSDRVNTAIDLYFQGKGNKILASGDNGQASYDEVNAMKQAFLDAGIPPEDLFLDHAGFDTYDSVYRAKEIFGSNSLIIISQEFHLPRSLFIAKKLDIDAVGVSADRGGNYNLTRSIYREKLASVKAFINVYTNAKPRFLGEKIPISGDGRASWD